MKFPFQNPAYWAGVVACLLVASLGCALGILINRLPAQPGDLLSFAGSLFGAALTVFGAIWVFHIQQSHSERSEVDAVDELLKQFEVMTALANKHAAADDARGAKSALHLAVDKIVSAKRILDRSRSTHLGMIHTSTSLDILEVAELRRVAGIDHPNWTLEMQPKLAMLAAAAAVLRTGLRRPELRAHVPDVRIDLTI